MLQEHAGSKGTHAGADSALGVGWLRVDRTPSSINHRDVLLTDVCQRQWRARRLPSFGHRQADAGVCRVAQRPNIGGPACAQQLARWAVLVADNLLSLLACCQPLIWEAGQRLANNACLVFRYLSIVSAYACLMNENAGTQNWFKHLGRHAH